MVMTVETGFKPIHIKLETQEEVDLLFSVFNFFPLMEVIRDLADRLPTKLHEGLRNTRSDKAGDYFAVIRKAFYSHSHGRE